MLPAKLPRGQRPARDAGTALQSLRCLAGQGSADDAVSVRLPGGARDRRGRQRFELACHRRGNGIGGPNAEYCLALALALNFPYFPSDEA